MAEAGALSVVMVSAGFHPVLGGAEKQALELAVALKARGVEVRVVTRRLAGLAWREEIRGIGVRRLWCAGSGFLNAATFLLALSFYLWRRVGRDEVVHVHLAGSPAIAAALWGRILGGRVFVKLGGGKGIGELSASARTGSGKMKLWALRVLKPQFVAVAQELKQEASIYLGSTSQVHLLPNGVDTDAYRPRGSADKSQARRKLGWPQGDTGFLYVGRFSPEKQLPVFLEAWMAQVRKMSAKSFAVFVGEGPEFSLLKEMVRREGFNGQVFFHQTMENIGPVYVAADVFVLPSLSEGLSNALLEAMASGLAVLASRVGGTAEAIGGSPAGLLFEPGDTEGLKAHIARFLASPDSIAAMGLSARRIALDRYSMAQVAQAYEDLYRGKP